ncbi:DUF1207 domain-containing protein [Telmatospirillum sp. J64-1]|uniref:DUF1207 domain-containing protein n=1 Tax=Telmatospirillum sp. J64-1 TaxID=2502183 RepID=UPI00115D6F7D|nr:DUF1207 domain-containing protein [Telmatospirillum sp. J64-1]
MTATRRVGVILGVALLTMAASPADGDSFLAGYVAAVLEREFGLPDQAVIVRDGVVFLEEEAATEPVIRAVEGLRGVRAVEIAVQPDPPMPELLPDPPGEGAVREAVLLPGGRLFEPLIADPRWPRFSASYQYTDDGYLRHAGVASLGHDFWFYEAPGLGGRWAIGLEGAVFSIFALDTESHDLVNADYHVAIPLAWRQGRHSALLRLFHQSSHLGDEYMMRGEMLPWDLAWEGVDFRWSWDVTDTYRLYGGGGYLFRVNPDHIDPGLLQAGAEWRGDGLYSVMGRDFRPVAALDVKAAEMRGWRPGLSLRTGLQVEGEGLSLLQFLLEAYSGPNQHGQFYTEDIHYLGLGIHASF